MLEQPTTPSVRPPRRSGFTLIEMLVAVGLVLIIMLLLANVFSLASSTAIKQKGTAENDQQARTFTTIIQGDICSRSFRDVIPFHAIPAGSDIKSYFPPDEVEEALRRRRGYFCISENDPDSQKDDVLSFTVDYDLATNLELSCVDKTTFDIRARAVILGPVASDPFLFNNPNQPEADDGFPYQNQSGLSTKAEVCYFLRDGNLHRRVMLLRDMYTTPGSDDGQPTDNMGNPLVTGDYPGMYSPSPDASGVFWRDFDYCALYNTLDSKPWFLIGAGVDSAGGALTSSLDNSLDGAFLFDFDGSGPNLPVGVPLAVGIPHFRFGHDIQDRFGRPREFLNAYSYNVNAPTPAMGEENFFGRFTTQETAHSNFTYPGNLNNGNPMNLNSVTLNGFNKGLVDPYHDENNRRGDSILLTNVLEFDIKVWDDRRQRFVDLGNTNGGQFNAARNQRPGYGNTFDTWHWRSELAVPGASPLPAPPYWPGNDPGNVGPDGAPGALGIDDNLDGTIDNPAERGWIGTDDEVPLKAIEITIRYTDPSSGLVRQVTLLNSLLD